MSQLQLLHLESRRRLQNRMQLLQRLRRTMHPDSEEWRAWPMVRVIMKAMQVHATRDCSYNCTSV